MLCRVGGFQLEVGLARRTEGGREGGKAGGVWGGELARHL